MTTSEFVKYVINYCSKQKIKLILSTEVLDCTGYFNHSPKEMYIYTKRDEEDWISDLLHEYCHATQFIENLPLYWETNKFNLMNDTNNWNRYNKKELKYILGITRDLELDCEQRAIKFIKDNELELDLVDYIKGANATLYHYNMMIKYSWDCKSPCDIPEIYDKMPTNLNRSYKRTPNWLKELYAKHYGG